MAAAPRLRLPPGDAALFVRSDFSDDAKWRATLAAVQQPSPEGFTPNLVVVDDRAWEGAGAAEVAAAHRGDRARSVAFVVDAATLADPARAVLCVRIGGRKVQTLRALPTEVWSLENNLSLANMDWGDFSRAAVGGVFRGFD